MAGVLLALSGNRSLCFFLLGNLVCLRGRCTCSFHPGEGAIRTAFSQCETRMPKVTTITIALIMFICVSSKGQFRLIGAVHSAQASYPALSAS